MEKSRSSLRKSSAKDKVSPGSTQKRRISFRNRKSVRVFNDEEDVKTWKNSYEESAERSNNSQNLESMKLESTTMVENKENMTRQTTQNLQIETSSYRASLLSVTTDYINTYTCQNKELRLDNTPDITLMEVEHCRMKPETKQQKVIQNATEVSDVPAINKSSGYVRRGVGPEEPPDSVSKQSESITILPGNKGVIVRKVCKPIATTPADINVNRLARMKQTQMDTVAATVATDQKDMMPKAISPIRSSNRNDVPKEQLSPLITPDHRGILRQENDNISLDGIPVSSNMPLSTPASALKQPAVETDHKQRGTPAPKKKNAATDILCNDSLELSFGFGLPAQAQKPQLPRYSQADELLLDNTSYLTKAKVGDETASRNTSKCSTGPNSNSQKKHFNYQSMNMELQMVTEDDIFKKPHGCKSLDFTEPNEERRRRGSEHFEAADLLLDATADFMQPLSQTLIFEETNANIDLGDARLNDTKSKRQTVLPNDDMQLEAEALSDTKPQIAAEPNRKRQTIFVREDMLLEADEQPPQQPHHIAEATKAAYDDMEMDEETQERSAVGIEERGGGHMRAITPNISSHSKERRQTLVFSEDVELDFTLAMGEIDEDLKASNKQQPMILVQNDNNDIPAEQYDSPQEAGGLAAESAGAGDQRYFQTPRSWARMYAPTPQRSIIEFQYHERQMAMEADDEAEAKEIAAASHVAAAKPDVSMAMTLAESTTPVPLTARMLRADKKRFANHLTPLQQQLNKKRQSIMFNNCSLDESLSAHSLPPRETSGLPLRRSIFQPQCMQLDQSQTAISESEAKELAPPNRTQLNRTTWDAMELTMLCDDTASEAKPVVVPTVLITDTDDLVASATAGISSRLCSRIPVPITGSGKKHLKTEAFNALSQSTHLDADELHNSLDTIELPRRIVRGAPSMEELILPEQPASVALKAAAQRQSMYEDNHITISDVSVFYAAEGQSLKAETPLGEAAGAQSLRLSSEDNSVTMRNYLHLSASDEIDNTRLTLVDTLLDSDNDVSAVASVRDQKPAGGKVELAEVKPSMLYEDGEMEEPLPVCAASFSGAAPNSSMCRKCRRCQHTITDETVIGELSTMMESFALPKVLPLWQTAALERLERLRKLPHLADVHDYYRRKSLEEDITLSVTLVEADDAWKQEAANEVDLYLAQKRKRMERFKQELEAQSRANVWRGTFVERLQQLLRSPSGCHWIFNARLQNRQLLLFQHRKIVVIAIEVKYVELTPHGDVIKVLAINLRNNVVRQKNWKPVDHMMYFQLQMELLPIELWAVDGTGSSNSDQAVAEMLQRSDAVCLAVHNLAMQLWRIVSRARAFLVRDANQTYVRKIVRSIVRPADGGYPRVTKREFRINIMNIRELCFKNILMPALHLFREDIQLMPTGLDFLSAFLQQPMAYLRD